MQRRDILKGAIAATGLASVTGRPTEARRAGQAAAAGTVETIHVHPARGAEGNAGTKEQPLRSLADAVKHVNQSAGDGPATIVLSEGIYALDETIVLKPERRTFTKTARLTIRSEVLPDDPAWHTGRMPTLINTMPLPSTWNGRPDPLGGAADGFMVDTSHVTFRGLKLLGYPVVETPKPGMIQRLYGISRLRRGLDDLEIAQCLFIGDDLTNPLHVAVIAHGTGIDVNHCVFRGMKISVVYWTGGSTGHAMRHCVCDGVYGSGVWTAAIASDFDYRNNVVLNSNYVWTAQGGASAAADAGGPRAGGVAPSAAPAAPLSYKVVDSYFAANRRLAGSGTGARLEYADIDPSFLQLVGTTVTEQAVPTERDQTKRHYLHPVGGTAAAKVGAGLFTTPIV
jgi:hypothetical protein